ncbi:MAG: hypothetical protein OXC63_01610 [Aestuariivita sp.]|nr:hypothetical protein [Aestuariivita sp.]
MRVTIWILTPIPRFFVRLSAISEVVQQTIDGSFTDGKPLLSENGSETGGTFARPTARVFGITTGCGFDQAVKSRLEFGVLFN